MVLTLPGCNNPGSSTGGQAWKILFEDDFNRSDTTGRDLGSNWTIYTAGVSDEMNISGNQVYSSYIDSGVGVMAVYNGAVDYTEKLRVSVKFKINHGGTWPVEIAGIAISTNEVTAGYYLQLNYAGPDHVMKLAEFNGSIDVGVSTTNIALANNTWYLLELESDGILLTATLKDETGTNVIGTVTLTDSPRTYTTGQVLFYNYTVDGVPDPTGDPVYFDDFELEAYR